MTKLECPCGTGDKYIDCCGVYIEGNFAAPTPALLMRSRYTAYTKANVDYIAKTMRAYALEGFDKDEARTWAGRVEWLGLEVLRSTVDGAQGFVEFKATYTENMIKQVLHEMSEFVLDEERWYYVDGIQLST